MTMSTMKLFGRTGAATLASAVVLSGTATAQSYPPPSRQGGYYDNGYGSYDGPASAPPTYNGQPVYNGRPPANAQDPYAAPPPPDDRYASGYDETARANLTSPPPPPGYDGSQPPPPPPGYRTNPAWGDQTAQDRRYEAYAEDWAQRYCVKSRSHAGAGAVIGGLFGALLGSSVAGWDDRGTGALVGGLAGAAGGAIVGGSDAGATSPGCPPGFVVRGGAPVFSFTVDTGPYYYAAPVWYRPWYFYEGRWAYRPYPYHDWYYRNYGYGRGYGYGERGEYRGYRGGRFRRY